MFVKGKVANPDGWSRYKPNPNRYANRQTVSALSFRQDNENRLDEKWEQWGFSAIAPFLVDLGQIAQESVKADT
jgi:hypothetical protein